MSTKLVYSIVVAFALEPIVMFLKHSVNLDWSLVASILGLTVVDTVLGLTIALKAREVNSRRFADVFKKLWLYVGLILMLGFLAKHPWLVYIDTPLYALIMAREAISILEKSGKMGWAVPAWLTARLEQFVKSGIAPADAPAASPATIEAVANLPQSSDQTHANHP